MKRCVPFVTYNMVIDFHYTHASFVKDKRGILRECSRPFPTLRAIYIVATA
jgi:hypothetical protein